MQSKNVTDEKILSVCIKLKDKLKYPDQDILNYLYKDSVIYLQRKYDRYVDFVTEYEKEYLNNDKN